jgi:CubicO group peptidase (beta-lactamase class C family)
VSKKLGRIVALLFLAFASAGPSANGLLAQDQQHAAELRQTVDKDCEAFLQRMLFEEHFTGVALVKKADKVLHAKGYGEATESKQNSLDTVFHVASITKQFTAAATLQLVEAGKINLETPINEYLPKKYRSDHWKNVTCSHLLSHSSGIEDYALVRDYYNVVDGFCLGDTVDGMIREAMEKPLRFKPGSKFEYSNIGFTLLGEIIENQSSLPFDAYVKKRILNPLGMTSSRVHVIGHVPTDDEASGYRWNAELKKHKKDEVVTLPVTAPDGGLTTTLSDFIKWIDVYTDANPLVVSKDSVKAMTTQRVPLDPKDVKPGERGYGYGLFVGDGLLSHPGYIVGFRSHFILDPEKDLLVLVFSNNTTNDPGRIARRLFKIVDARVNK